MKTSFNEETSQYLGYQKHYPTAREWILYLLVGGICTLACIGAGVVLITHF